MLNLLKAIETDRFGGCHAPQIEQLFKVIAYQDFGFDKNSILCKISIINLNKVLGNNFKVKVQPCDHLEGMA